MDPREVLPLPALLGLGNYLGLERYLDLENYLGLEHYPSLENYLGRALPLWPCNHSLGHVNAILMVVQLVDGPNMRFV